MEEGPPISFAYEALAWGLHAALLDDVVRIMKLVDRPNFGLCIDTYHVLARVWADPRSIGGRIPGGDASLKATIDRFMKDCPVDKILFIQLSDAEKMDPPLLPGHPAYKVVEDPTMSWCLYGRLFPLEKEYGAYFPMEGILKAWLVEKAWTGWVSMEMFHRDEKREDVGPEVLAKRGMRSWAQVKRLVGLD
jgi:sugar phosphate isomerase/epimerase